MNDESKSIILDHNLESGDLDVLSLSQRPLRSSKRLVLEPMGKE